MIKDIEQYIQQLEHMRSFADQRLKEREDNESGYEYWIGELRSYNVAIKLARELKKNIQAQTKEKL